MKKSILTLIAILAITITSSAQWKINGNSISSGQWLGTTNKMPLIIKTNGTSTSAPQMVITGTDGPNKGFVGINTIFPTQRLHVKGNIMIQGDNNDFGASTLMFSKFNSNTKWAVQMYQPHERYSQLNFLTYTNQYPNGLVDGGCNALTICVQDQEPHVGIGTSFPEESLEIENGNILLSTDYGYYPSSNEIRFRKTKDNDDKTITETTSGIIQEDGYSPENIGLALYGNKDATTPMQYPIYISGTEDEKYCNNVGINNCLPYQQLHVASGNILITKDIFNHHAPGNENGSILFGDDIDLDHPYGHWGIGYDVNGNKQGLNFWKPFDGTATLNYVLFLSNATSTKGNVGIGTNNPTHKLTVNGTIKASEVIVRRDTEWPDYVFSSDYTLQNLSELENYVIKNKHLPGIPSASEIEQNGVELGQMNAMLLEKVEQLTLYIIEQQKQIDALKSQMKTNNCHEE